MFVACFRVILSEIAVDRAKNCRDVVIEVWLWPQRCRLPTLAWPFGFNYISDCCECADTCAVSSSQEVPAIPSSSRIASCVKTIKVRR